MFKYAYQIAGCKTGVAQETALVNYTKEVLGGTIANSTPSRMNA